jgi:hypothetical protein
VAEGLAAEIIERDAREPDESRQLIEPIDTVPV